MRSVISICSSNRRNIPAAEEQGYQGFIRYFCCWRTMGLEAVVAVRFLWEQLGDARAWILNYKGIRQERWEKDFYFEWSGKLICFILSPIGS